MTNNTQAPERIWVRITDHSVMHSKPDDADELDREFVSASLAAAQTAAAWLAGRDECVNVITEGCAVCRTVGFTGFADRVMEIAAAIKDLTPPADASAALDALIAERVREAEQAGWIRAAKAIKGILAVPQPGTVSEIIDDLIASRIDAARASKEGRDG